LGEGTNVKKGQKNEKERIRKEEERKLEHNAPNKIQFPGGLSNSQSSFNVLEFPSLPGVAVLYLFFKYRK
jgi:hypothetical protein